LIQSGEEVVAQVLQMVSKQTVNFDGGEISVKADTICVHGDGEHAVHFVKEIYKALQANNIQIKAIL
jgi:UPF0271 protein